ncbi:MAG: 3-hydroxyacyl-CoA dehydrogenase NAD-binding domain-containing protein [Candidatus Hadarchaeales archaeon]
MGKEGFERVAVIGAGSMGHGIAELFAMHGYEVNLVDLKEEILREALRKIEKSLGMIGGLEEDTGEILERIHPTTDLGKALEKVDFALEAATEKLELKRELFRKMDRFLPHEAILSTNTSSIRISSLAEVTSRPERVIGTHFVHAPQRVDGFMPPHFSILLPLVEVVKTEFVLGEVLELTVELMKGIGKVPEVVKDSPAFVANRLLVRGGLEAYHALEEADPYEIDASAIYGLGMPLGIFQLIDVIGLDVALYILEYLQVELGREYSPPEDLKALVEEGYLGQKSGRGFYDYSQGIPEVKREDWKTFDPLRLLAPMVNEVCGMIQAGITNADQVERVSSLSFVPKGIFSLAEEFGVEKIVKKLEELRPKGEWYEPSSLLRKIGSFSELQT